VFYPNAPYIFTDFIHVFNRTFLRAPPSEWLGLNALVWYDILMNAAFAFIGHFLGLVSMWMMSGCARRAWGRAASRALALAAILLSGFGIYLGRFSRLNSWDVLADPRHVLVEVAEAMADPKALLGGLLVIHPPVLRLPRGVQGLAGARRGGRGELGGGGHLPATRMASAGSFVMIE
jgi:uncharacterized membrane protein